jgi:glutamate-1-semialdehyde 2,1-aminomutase
LYERAVRVLPGGVTAAARRNAALGQPLYIRSAAGPCVTTIDGVECIDVCMSNGATLLGHGHPAVSVAIQQAVSLGVACGYDGEQQIRLAERLSAAVPVLEQLRFTSAGTEATFYALRVARAATGRTKVLKFEGHFHGFNDPLAFSFWPSAAQAGPELQPIPQQESAGIPAQAASDIVVASFNSSESFLAALDRHGTELAAVVLEPINYDAGGIVADPAFLRLVRDETQRRGIVLIFDEILSGYRLGPGAAHQRLGVTPDLCTLGKAIGGGLPLSVFGGKRELMSLVAPAGKAVHTGTYNAHLLPIMAAHAFLDVIEQPEIFPSLLRSHARLYQGLRATFQEAGVRARVQDVGARFGLFFGLDPDVPVTSYRQAATQDNQALYTFCRSMLERGVYVNAAWHHGISLNHSDEHVDRIIEAAGKCARSIP